MLEILDFICISYFIDIYAICAEKNKKVFSKTSDKNHKKRFYIVFRLVYLLSICGHFCFLLFVG